MTKFHMPLFYICCNFASRTRLIKINLILYTMQNLQDLRELVKAKIKEEFGTISEFSRHTGFNRTTLSRFLTGHTDITLSNFIFLANWLNLKITAYFLI